MEARRLERRIVSRRRARGNSGGGLTPQRAAHRQASALLRLVPVLGGDAEGVPPAIDLDLIDEHDVAAVAAGLAAGEGDLVALVQADAPDVRVRAEIQGVGPVVLEIDAQEGVF